MSGFDNGTMQGGIFAQTKQFGSVLRGLGPPTPSAGVTGDLYIDTQTWQLFVRRNGHTDPWGNYLFVVPVTYRATLNWFTASTMSNAAGANGDYALLWGGYPNYGLQPNIAGPKAGGVWPAAVPVVVVLNTLYTAENVHGI